MERSGAPAERWLLSRVDRSSVDAVTALLHKIAEQLATATADGVSIRRLSPDGRVLVSLAAHHPDPARRAALGEATAQAMDREDGLWKSVIDDKRVVRWHLPPGTRLTRATESQAGFLARFPVRAVLAAPLLHHVDVFGGVALVRFGSDVPYTEQDEALLTACAQRIAAALRFLAQVESLAAART